MTRSHVSLHLEPARGQDWMDAAACQGMDVNIWHPKSCDLPGDVISKEARLALMICNRCEVKSECLDWVMRIEGPGQGRRAGIYGGLTPKQRGRLARKANA